MTQQNEKYISDLKLERDDPKFAPDYEPGEQEQYGLGGYGAGLQYAIDVLEGNGLFGDFESGVSHSNPPALTRDQLGQALQDAWDEWCGDARAVPGCLEIRGPSTTRITADFHKEPNFLDAILWRLLEVTNE